MGKVRIGRREDDDDSSISSQRLKHSSFRAASTSAFSVSRVDKQSLTRLSGPSQPAFSRGTKRAGRSSFFLQQTSTPSAEVSPKRLCTRNGNGLNVRGEPSTAVIPFSGPVASSDNDVSASFPTEKLDEISERLNEFNSEQGDIDGVEYLDAVDNEDSSSDSSDSSDSIGSDAGAYESCFEANSAGDISAAASRNTDRNQSVPKSGERHLRSKMKLLLKDNAQLMEDREVSDDDDEEDVVSRSSSNNNSNCVGRLEISRQQQMAAGGDGIPSGVRLFLHRGSALVTLSDFAAVSFGGSAWLQVIRGSARVYGVRLRPADGPVHLQSIPGSCIKLSNAGASGANGGGQNLHDRLQLIGAGSAVEKARELISRFPKRTILVFHGLATTDRYYTSLKPNFHIATDSTPEDMWTNSRFYLVPSEHDFTAKASSKRFDDLTTSLVKAAGRTAVRVAVVGSRNSGKSTTLRVLCNRILQSSVDDEHHRPRDTSSNSVPLFVLDLDPGQTEFTPPSCISLVEVNRLLMGPPGAHQIKPRKSFLLGDSTAGARPEAYVAAVASLVVHIKNELLFNHILIVNTMGWLSGIGDVLLGTILDLVKPCKILATSDGVQVPVLAWPAKEIQIDVPVVRVNALEGLYARDLYTKPVKASDQRRSTIINYFGGLNILNTKTIVVPWNSVALHEVSGLCPPQELLRLINASVVALARAPAEMIWKSKSDPTLPMLIRECAATSHEPLECLGFAFVRAVDMVCKTLQIVTPETEETARSANALVHCTGVNITDYLVLNQNRDGRQGTAPYSAGRHAQTPLYIREQ